MNLSTVFKFFAATGLCLVLSYEAAAQNSEWMRVVTDDKEFSVLMPGQPAVHLSRDFYHQKGGELVEARRVLHIYEGGVAFIVTVYDVSNPKKLLKEVIDLDKRGEVTESEITLNGTTGLQRVVRMKDYFGKFHYFTTKRRLYVIYAASRAEAIASLERFFSSVTLGRANAPAPASKEKITLKPAPEEIKIKPAAADKPVTVLKGSEVTRKAIIVWKPEPGFTEEARRRNISGTVLLRLILSASGQVTNIEVIKGLGSGLTERAVAAASHITFLPAEKDGSTVSHWVRVEYNFNIY